MRPINKGNCPVDNNGNLISVTEYGQWRSHLIARIGYYCAYCNMPLSHSLQVEHVSPKNPPVGTVPGSALDWDNMLIACGPCNNAKDNTPIDLSKFYFPENHNTLLPFEHIIHTTNSIHAIVKEATTLNPVQAQKAKDTIELTKLDQIDLRDKVVDIRTIKRRDALTMIQQSFLLFQQIKVNQPNRIVQTADYLALVAKGYGFFGHWFRTFKNEPEVIRALLNNNTIPGTATNCFDPNNGYAFLNRNPNNNHDPI